MSAAAPHSSTDAGRTLILCFDGTSNKYSQKNTNVVKFLSLLKNDAPSRQLIYYQPGIGTYTNPGILSPVKIWLANLMDQAIAWYIGAHITGGYKWLMNHYRKGDRICIFGFSRGAYTARALAGMINKVGLLPSGNVEHVTIAYDLYRTDENEEYSLSDGFRDTFSQVVPIQFVGVWDSVSSVGLFRSQLLPQASSNHIISTFRHAMSLDEHRGRFMVDSWHVPRPDSQRSANGLELRSAANRTQQSTQGYFSRFVSWLVYGSQEYTTKPKWLDGTKLVPASGLFIDRPKTSVREVWFTGDHGDVGGGHVVDRTDHNFADVTLRWMVRECELNKSGIIWDKARLELFAIDLSPERLKLAQDITNQVPPFQPETEWPSYDEKYAKALGKFKDGRADLEDSKSSIHDELGIRWRWWPPSLKINFGWWLLEFIPMCMWFQDKDGKWSWRIHFNVGRSRKAPTTTSEQPKVHVSVLATKKHDAKYEPRVKFEQGMKALIVD